MATLLNFPDNHPCDPEDGSPIGTPCQPVCKQVSGNHCTVCHHTFRGVGAFDRHRHKRGCLNPVSMGLVRKDGVWVNT